MKRKIVFAMVLILLLSLVGCGRKNDGIVREKWSHTYDGYPVVYISPEVSTKGLVSVLRALEVPDGENAAIKLSNTETDTGFLWTDLIEGLPQSFNQAVIMEGYPTGDLSSYDYTIILSHFRSHSKAGFNGTIKQTAAISAPSNEACCLADYHNGLETLAENGKHTVDDLDGKIIYVNVMDRLSIESSGITLPASNSYNIGILASYDPVALDQACVDLIYILQEGKTFAEQIEACNGIQMLVYAEAIGLGSRTYAFSSIES